MDVLAEIKTTLAVIVHRVDDPAHVFTSDDVALVNVLLSVSSWTRRPEVDKEIQRCAEAVLTYYARELLMRQGKELYRSAIWRCPGCGQSPIIILVKDAEKGLVQQRCPKCQRTEEVALTQAQMLELRTTGARLDNLGQNLKRKT